MPWNRLRIQSSFETPNRVDISTGPAVNEGKDQEVMEVPDIDVELRTVQFESDLRSRQLLLAMALHCQSFPRTSSRHDP